MAGNHTTRAPQEKVCGYEYTVRRGDSFYLIANRLGVPLRDLLEANSDINPARLMVGDVLCIPMEEDDSPPAEQAPSVQPPSVQVPSVQQPAEQQPAVPDMTGDDDLDAPATLPDQPASPDDAVMDDAIFVCPEGSRHTVVQGETAADIQLRANVNLQTLQMANPNVDLMNLRAGQTICIPTSNIACAAPLTYTLQTDENLESTALKLNASLSALLRANPCLAPSDFKAGACIYIPED
ncbi:MAG: LysM peptidoglycan-binding domain-containing protein [Clostridia bacterium]|nr:LysM peptidoglycan-binding domain-containing protein [Clostridia bacterium]